ncbi:BACON domain-containing protein [Xylanibacter muris]|uniref:Outer membrane beta-barrel protein n=1 Tax=Xylanibacter muris TaxID=2736290 RepID=A0ABX2ANW2_9BACT|nr:BACON domain-containing carbohydrate-binding protein [Xylanibacter muris]NPD91717.1 outer membrane beta-barrel protein [Xylanibacter muris]
MLYQEGNTLVEQGKLEKARSKFQQVINCGNNLYVPDSEKRIAWIDRILRKPNTVKPFSLSDNEVVIPYQGGQDVITVDGNGSWSASIKDNNEGWCKIKKEKGKIYIISDANEDSSDRTCEVLVRMGNKTKIVLVKNEKAPEMLIPSVENLTFPYKGETNTIEIRSNTNWEVTSIPGWVVSTKENGKIKLTALANDKNEDRSAEIKVESSTKTVVINIYQGAGLDHLAFSKNELHFGPDGGDEYVNILTDAQDWKFGDFPHWCQVTKVADNLLRIHCTPNEPINMSREASVNVTTGKQTSGINVSQEAKPLVAIIPISGIGGRALSFGFNAGYMFPMISASSGGSYTGSPVNYANGTSLEEASYSNSSGFSFGGYADIRVYKNLYLTAGMNFIHYKYKNTFQSNDVRNVMVGSDIYYAKGKIQDNYQEDYTFSALEIPILASYRFPVTKTSHIQINVGPVINWGLSAKMKLSGTSDGEKLKAYAMDRFGMTDNLLDGIELYPHHIQASGTMDLYKKNVSYTETYVEHNYAKVDKSQDFETSPLKRMNVCARFGVAYEYSGISIGVDYNLMITNMANKRYWEGSRWTVFDYTGSNLMSGYKQRNNYLQIHIGYTFRY